MNFREMNRTWIIAEIGVNHEGDVAVAEDLIIKAAQSGADAVKFQTFEIEQYISTVQPERRERTKGFQLSREDFRHLSEVARKNDVVFFSTPLSKSDADFLDEIAPIFKISSGDLTLLDLIGHVAAKGKPMIISTGLGTEAEIEAAMQAVLAEQPDAIEKGNLALLHCVSAYPTSAEDANLRNMGWLSDRYGAIVGYSDHTLGTKACELAVAAGAKILEKHFTYRKEDQAFHDHAISADPKDMTELVEAVRNAEIFMGSAERVRGEAEVKNKDNMRRSIGALRDIPSGVPVEREWLTYLRPAWGLGPERLDDIVGSKLGREVLAGDIINQDDLV